MSTIGFEQFCLTDDDLIEVFPVEGKPYTETVAALKMMNPQVRQAFLLEPGDNGSPERLVRVCDVSL